MKKLGLLTIIAAAMTTGCASNTQEDNYHDASFQLCNTEVKVYSVSDNGRVRIICADESKFSLRSEQTLNTMLNLNGEYCDGGGLGQFNESSKYYSFKCKAGALISIKK